MARSEGFTSGSRARGMMTPAKGEIMYAAAPPTERVNAIVRGGMESRSPGLPGGGSAQTVNKYAEVTNIYA